MSPSIADPPVTADSLGLGTAAEADTGDFASAAHAHSISDVTSLQAALDGKAGVAHSHVIADTTGLQAALDGKAASTHNHAASEINSGTVATARLGSGTANSSSYLRGDQTWAVPSGSGAAATYGSTDIDFGVYPGASVVSLAVAAASITASMRVMATIAARTTVDHSLDEHVVEEIEVRAGNVADGVGFTLYARTRNNNLTGLWAIDWSYA